MSSGHLCLWSTKTGNILRNKLFEATSARVVYDDMDFSRDGARLVARCSVSLILWDAQTGDVICTHSFPHGISSVAFSPNNTQFVSGSEDGDLCLWDARTGRMISSWKGHTRSIPSVAYFPDGQLFISASRDGTVRIWDSNTGTRVRQSLIGPLQAINCAAVAPDTSRIAAADNKGTLCIWDAMTGELISAWASGHITRITSITFVSNGTQVVSGSEDKTLRLWDVGQGMESIHVSLNVHGSAVTSAAFSPDDRYVVSGSMDRTARLWDAATGECIGAPFTGAPYGISDVAFSSNGSRITAVCEMPWACSWNVKTGEAVFKPGLKPGVTALTPGDGQIAHIPVDLAEVRFWDLNSGEPERTRALPLEGVDPPVDSVTFSPDGQRIMLISEDGLRLHICSAKTGQEVVDLLAVNDPTCMVLSAAFSPDGRRAVSGSFDRTMRMWDVQTGRGVATFSGCYAPITAVAVSPDSTRVVSGSYDGEVRVWDAETLQLIGVPLIGHHYPINSVAFSSAGTQVVSTSDDRTMRLWDVGHTLETLTPLSASTSMPDASPISSKSPSLSQQNRTQYPSSLFPSGLFTLKDGWIKGSEGELLLWVPPVHRHGLNHPRSRVIGANRTTELDFSNYIGGEDWAGCFSPQSADVGTQNVL